VPDGQCARRRLPVRLSTPHGPTLREVVDVQTSAPFEYERATSVEHALSLLELHGPEARIVAGGHSLLPMMKLRIAYVDCLIDVNDLTELDYIRVEGDEIVIGAMTRHAAVLSSAVLGEHYRIFHDAERVVADPIVRNRGTVGGSLCQADPSEDLSAVCACLGATVVVRSSSGSRTIPAREFHLGPYETAVEPAEMLVQVRVPIRSGAGSAYEKVERRYGDWAVAAAGAFVRLDGDRVSDVGIGLTAVGAQHFCAPEAEHTLRGQPATEEHLAAAAQVAADHCNPYTDQRGPADYKRHLAKELTLRALRRSVARARGEGA
jgi:aerobic carbon-monoxide dehydrogenase medium subunit